MDRSDISYFEEIAGSMNKKRVRYLVVGGVAVNLYGIERMTADLDLIVDLEESNLKKFISAMKELGYKPKVPVKAEDLISPAKRKEWIKEKGMKVFSFYHPKHPFRLIDVLIEIPVDFETAYAKRVKTKSSDVITPLASVDTLIRLKEIAGRPQDTADIYHLKRIKGEKQK
ncbi:MAG: hypothetical protein NT096_03515 [Proteobacteria bacterium]|nr:hypothetical protein [Pseudomonadota bacterium]